MKKKQHKNEKRSSALNLEILSIDGDGIFEGYAATFNDIDSYGSRIMAGAFAKTLQERSGKVKILFNHDEDMPIGKPLEMREDNVGLWVRGKLSLGTPKADEAYILMKDGVFDCMSIGFNVPRGKDRVVDGVREITEIKLYEFSPVTFPANENAGITQVRAEDFGETVTEREMNQKQWTLLWSLEETIDDIWWSSKTREEVDAALRKAIDDFANAYKTWLTNWFIWLDRHESTEFRSVAAKGDFGVMLAEHLSVKGLTIEGLAMQSALTVKDIRGALKSSVEDATVDKFAFDEVLQQACIESRKVDIEALATKLNATLSHSEREQFSALLGVTPTPAAERKESQNALGGLLEDVRKLSRTGEHHG